MVNSKTLLAATGLLALSSAAPTSSTKAKCIDGEALQIIRFDDLKGGTKIPTEVPDGYAGFQWGGMTVEPVPVASDGKDKYPFFGTSPPNAIVVYNGKNGGGLGLKVGPEEENFGLNTFNAACIIPAKDGSSKAVDCEFMYAGDSGGTASNKHFSYTAGKGEPTFKTFTPNGEGGLSALTFHVTSGKVEGVKPTLVIDNMVVQNTCGKNSN